MDLVKGKGASAGIAVGPILVKPAEQKTAEKKTVLSPQQELERFYTAQQDVVALLETLKEKALTEAGEEAAAIFDVHQLMVQDPDLTEQITDLITGASPLPAEEAVQQAGEEFAAMLESMDDA